MVGKGRDHSEKVCPKDPYPLQHIDTMVDAATSHELLMFLDTSNGCNRIKIHPMDVEKITFITNMGIYCYLARPFGLQNAGATFE